MKRIVTQARAQSIFDKALEFLEKTGLEYTDDALFNRIYAKVSCRYSNGRILFPSNQMATFFEKRKSELRDSQSKQEEITIGGHWHSWYLCDPITNIPRDATYDEAVQMAKLSEELGGGVGPIPVAPQNIKPALHTVECEKLALLHTKNMGGCLTATSDEEIEVILKMYSIAGRKYTLALEPLISPMRLNSEVMEIYFKWCNNTNIDISIFTPIPMAGATAPLVFPAALVQVLAEALALDYLFYNLSDGRLRNGFNLRLDPFDMQNANIAFGSPEWCLFKQALVELWQELIGGNFVFGMFRTNSRRVDAQCMLERTASFIWQAELGIKHFSAVGQLSVDEVYSPVQAVIDFELAKYGNRLLKSLDTVWLDEEDTYKALNEGIASHSYLDGEYTFDYFKKTFDVSRITNTSGCEAWRRDGMPSLEQEAWKKAQELIAKHSFTLEKEKADEIEHVFSEYAKKF